MGLLGNLRNKAKSAAKKGAQRVINKVATKANIPMAISREDKDRMEIANAEAAGAPKFEETAAVGWALGQEELARLGSEGLGMLQARWTDSELMAKNLVDAWCQEMDGVLGFNARRWAQFGDILLTSWQARGVDVAQSWTQTFDHLGQSWEKAMQAHGKRVSADGWRQAAGDFDRQWQKAWDGLQADIQRAGADMKKSVADGRGSLGDGLPVDVVNAFDKAGTYLENTILRAEAELWGVWGTNGARIRGVARVVSEDRGKAEETYPGIFEACRGDFDTGFKHTLSDFETSWKAALRLIKEATD